MTHENNLGHEYANDPNQVAIVVQSIKDRVGDAPQRPGIGFVEQRRDIAPAWQWLARSILRMPQPTPYTGKYELNSNPYPDLHPRNDDENKVLQSLSSSLFRSKVISRTCETISFTAYQQAEIREGQVIAAPNSREELFCIAYTTMDSEGRASHLVEEIVFSEDSVVFRRLGMLEYQRALEEGCSVVKDPRIGTTIELDPIKAAHNLLAIADRL